MTGKWKLVDRGLWQCPSCGLKQRIVSGIWQCRGCQYGALEVVEYQQTMEMRDGASRMVEAADTAVRLALKDNVELESVTLEAMDELRPESPLYQLLGELSFRVKVLDMMREEYPQAYVAMTVLARTGTDPE